MAVGRVGEVAMRCWQLADKMKAQRVVREDSEFNDNNRIKRYVAKYTINPCHHQWYCRPIDSSQKLVNLQIWFI